MADLPSNRTMTVKTYLHRFGDRVQLTDKVANVFSVDESRVVSLFMLTDFHRQVTNKEMCKKNSSSTKSLLRRITVTVSKINNCKGCRWVVINYIKDFGSNVIHVITL